MDLPKKGQKGKVITFEDIVTHIPITKVQMKDENDELAEEEFKKKFL